MFSNIFFLLKDFKRADLILAIGVLLITAMLVVPLPTELLDILLALNLAFGVIILLAGIYMPNAFSLLAFPSLLLLSTLFRLGLNVASSRLILSQGDAGRVIEAFGSFLIQGEVIVGGIIFSIITIVNFIVISRGASRVSEVAARFALDSLPGKQLAIDADLRAGLITPNEARERREELRKESQLYGSMDGAMKFVQGDAIAGFLIIFANIFGGFFVGLSKGLPLSDVIQTYTTLTVGDGLVNQIPALMISICAGMVVTRVSVSENSTLGTEVGAQIFGKPGTIIFAGLLLIIIGSLPGLPTLPFYTVGCGLLIFSYFRFSGDDYQVTSGNQLISAEWSKRSQLKLPSSVRLNNLIEQEYTEPTSFSVNLDGLVSFEIFKSATTKYLTIWRDFQEEFFALYGYQLSSLRVMEAKNVEVGFFSVYLGRSLILSGRIPPNSILVEINPEMAEVLGLEVVEKVEHPLTGSNVFWAYDTPYARKTMEVANLRFFDFLEFLFLKIFDYARHNPEEIVSMTDLHSELKKIEKAYPGFQSEIINSQLFSLPRTLELTHELIRQGVLINNFKMLLENIISYCASEGVSMNRADEFILLDLVRYIRLNRRKQLCTPLLSVRKTLRVITLSPKIEEIFDAATDPRSLNNLTLSQREYDFLISTFKNTFDPLRNNGIWPYSLLCSGELRNRVVAFVRGLNLYHLPVLEDEEIDHGLLIEVVGIWGD